MLAMVFAKAQFDIISRLVCFLVVFPISVANANADASEKNCKIDGPIRGSQSTAFFALTELFETDHPNEDYGHLDPIPPGAEGDGRGYCAGLVSFCSNTDDMADVIEVYTQSRPNNPLQAFVPAMRALSNANSASVQGLQGLPDAWNGSVSDPLFREAQRSVRAREYLRPALALANELGIRSVLGRFVLYDTAVQHGVGGTKELIARLQKTEPKIPRYRKISEKKWLLNFIRVRKAELAHSEDDAATRDVWNESTPRADVLRNLVEDENWGMCGAIRLKSKDWNETIRCSEKECQISEVL